MQLASAWGRLPVVLCNQARSKAYDTIVITNSILIKSLLEFSTLNKSPVPVKIWGRRGMLNFHTPTEFSISKKQRRIVQITVIMLSVLCLLELPNAANSFSAPRTELDITTTFAPFWCNSSMHSIASFSVEIVRPVNSLRNTPEL